MSSRQSIWLPQFIAAALMFMLLAVVTYATEAAALPLRGRGASIEPQRYFVTASAKRSPPVRLYVEVSGRGEPIVLLHGLGGSTYTWRHMVPALARRNRVIAIDLRGFGRSEKPFDYAYDPHTQATLVIEVLRHLKVRGFTLVGHSFGGLVAMIAALEIQQTEPRLLKRLVVMDAPVLPQQVSPAVAFLQSPLLPYIALNLIPPQLAASFVLLTEKVGMGRITETDVNVYAQPYQYPAARHALIQTARQIVPTDAARLIQRYPSLRKPTLVLWCREDRVVPLATGLATARMLPKASLVVLDGCDHIPPEQRPDATLAALQKFVGH